MENRKNNKSSREKKQYNDTKNQYNTQRAPTYPTLPAHNYKRWFTAAKCCMVRRY